MRSLIELAMMTAKTDVGEKDSSLQSDAFIHLEDSPPLEPEKSSDESENDEPKLPLVDGGRHAWLFLAACFMLEASTWGVLDASHSN